MIRLIVNYRVMGGETPIARKGKDKRKLKNFKTKEL